MIQIRTTAELGTVGKSTTDLTQRALQMNQMIMMEIPYLTLLNFTGIQILLVKIQIKMECLMAGKTLIRTDRRWNWMWTRSNQWK